MDVKNIWEGTWGGGESVNRARDEILAEINNLIKKKKRTNENGEGVPHEDGGKHRFLPEHCSKLRVRERQRPQPQVRGCVGNHTQHELDRFDGLGVGDKGETKIPKNKRNERGICMYL